MEEGQALKPLILTVRVSSTPLPQIEPATPSSLELEIAKRTRRASQRSNIQFYKAALEFLSSVSMEATSVLQSTEEIPKLTKACSLKIEEQNYDTTWVTPSGSVKKSFRSCLEHSAPYRRRIDLSEFPPCLRPCPLKEELNEEFAEKYPFLSRGLTLSKILSLRDNLIYTAAVKMGIDAMVVAVAWIHFERLLSMNLLTKSNRKALCAACMLLTFKLYGEVQLSTIKTQMIELIQGLCALDPSNRLSPKAIKDCEFEAYAYLNFDLVLTLEDVEETHAMIQQRIERLCES